MITTLICVVSKFWENMPDEVVNISSYQSGKGHMQILACHQNRLGGIITIAQCFIWDSYLWQDHTFLDQRLNRTKKPRAISAVYYEMGGFPGTFVMCKMLSCPWQLERS